MSSPTTLAGSSDSPQDAYHDDIAGEAHMYAIKMKDGRVFHTELDQKSLATLVSGMRFGGVAHIERPREFVIALDQVAWIAREAESEDGA